MSVLKGKITSLLRPNRDTSCITKDCCKLLKKLTSEIENMKDDFTDAYNTIDKTNTHKKYEAHVIKQLPLLYLNKIMILLLYKNLNDSQIDVSVIQQKIEDTYIEFKDISAKLLSDYELSVDPNIVHYIDEQITLSKTFKGGSKKSVRKNKTKKSKKTRKSRK